MFGKLQSLNSQDSFIWASLSLYPLFDTNMVSDHNVIELPLQLKSAKAHGKNFIKVKAHLVRYFLRNHLFENQYLK